MDLTGIFPVEVLALGFVILGATFGTVFAITQAGLPSKWSYLAAIGVGALWGLLLGLASFGLDKRTFAATVMGAITGLGTQTASRRPAETIVTDGVTKLAEPGGTAALTVTTPGALATTTVTTSPDGPVA